MKDPAIQIHGSTPFAELRQLGIAPSDILDFSATVNPFSLPVPVRSCFTSDGIAAYPDNECYEARSVIAAFHNVPPEWVLVTAGLTEIIFSLPALFDTASYFSPSYGDYTAAYKRYQRIICGIPFPDSGLTFGATIDKLRSMSFQVLIICNPNNPTGDYLPVYRMQELCDVLGHATICIDESYQEMSENCDSAIPLTNRFRNLLVLKSLTKPFGIGGLRAGYAISSGGALGQLRMNLMPWGVSSIAQHIVAPLMSNYNYFQQQWADILVKKQELMKALSNRGFPVLSGRCPFFLVKTGDAERTRTWLLEEHHVAVRSCASFGMPEWIRIMPGRPEMNTRLLEGLGTLGK